MELLRVIKHRSILSESIYILLNVGLAIAVLISVVTTGTPWLGLILVLLSKWRVFAVRPRYWFAHVEANIVDLIVSVSVVVLMYLAGQSGMGNALIVQIGLAVFYAVWLLVLKPRTSRHYVAIQAGVAIVLGTMALESISYEWPSTVIVLAMWVIGYTTARHVLMSHSDEDTRLLSLIWGFVIAEISWLTYHWTIAYTLPLASGLKLPQVTLIILGLSFLAERVYVSYKKHNVVRTQDILLPAILVVSVIVILMFMFNSAYIGSV